MLRQGIILTFLFTVLSVTGQETSRVKRIKAAHRTYYSDIIIDATPEQVWSVLTDFKSYPNWSYCFVKLEGDFRNGGKVTTYLDKKPGKSKRQIIVDHILTVEEGVFFSWSDVFGMGITDHHEFRVERTENGKTKFIQSDEAFGGLTWLVGKAVTNYESKHYPIFNKALKNEVERRFGD